MLFSPIKEVSSQLKYDITFGKNLLDWREIYIFQIHTWPLMYPFVKLALNLPQFVLSVKRLKKTLKHLLVSCPYVSKLWDDVIIWLDSINIDVNSLSCKDIIFGIWKRIEDFASINNIIFISKPQYLYYCRVNSILTSLRVLIRKVQSVIKTEKVIVKLNNKLNLHRNKWGEIELNWFLFLL